MRSNFHHASSFQSAGLIAIFAEGATRQSRRSTADGFAVSEDANDAELRRSHQ